VIYSFFQCRDALDALFSRARWKNLSPLGGSLRKISVRHKTVGQTVSKLDFLRIAIVLSDQHPGAECARNYRQAPSKIGGRPLQCAFWNR
jgi:hypothetical protein